MRKGLGSLGLPSLVIHTYIKPLNKKVYLMNLFCNSKNFLAAHISYKSHLWPGKDFFVSALIVGRLTTSRLSALAMCSYI